MKQQAGRGKGRESESEDVKKEEEEEEEEEEKQGVHSATNHFAISSFVTEIDGLQVFICLFLERSWGNGSVSG